MNRHFLSLFLLSVVTLSCYAQSLELSNRNGVIPANSIIIQQGTPDSTELVTYLNVKNISGKAISVTCKKSELKMLDSTEVTMCWAGGCYPSQVNISPNSQSIDAGQTITDFSAHYTQSSYQNFKSGESVIRWVFYDELNPNDSSSVTIKYTTYPLGIDDAVAGQTMLSNAYPNPAGIMTNFNYSMPAGYVGSIIIRNILGSTVYTEALSAEKGKFTLNTSNMSDGIYFYSLVVNEKISQTRKLIVKH